MKVFHRSPSIKHFVESDFGSHPICITLYPFSASAADKFEVVGYYRITESITYGSEPNVLLNNQDLVKKYYAFNAVLYHDQNLNANDLKLAIGYAPDTNTHAVETAIYGLRKLFGHDFIKNDNGVFELGGI